MNIYHNLFYILLRQVAGKSDDTVCVERVTEAYGLTEGPHWDHRTQKLYFVDIYNQYIRKLDIATGAVTNAYIGKIMYFFFTSIMLLFYLYHKII